MEMMMRRFAVLAIIGAISAMTVAPAYACYYTIGYWKNHPDAWPANEITLGGVTYTKSQAIAILKTPPKGDASIILARQLIAAKLNNMDGAWYPPNLISDADAFLASIGGVGSDPSGSDRATCLDYATQLDDLNNTPW
jgi:hypothetical protein